MGFSFLFQRRKISSDLNPKFDVFSKSTRGSKAILGWDFHHRSWKWLTDSRNKLGCCPGSLCMKPSTTTHEYETDEKALKNQDRHKNLSKEGCCITIKAIQQEEQHKLAITIMFCVPASLVGFVLLRAEDKWVPFQGMEGEKSRVLLVDAQTIIVDERLYYLCSQCVKKTFIWFLSCVHLRWKISLHSVRRRFWPLRCEHKVFLSNLQSDD